MPELNLVVMKAASGPVLVPADIPTTETLDDMRSGDLVRGEFKKARNPKFHRKAFALLTVGFEAWEPNSDVMDQAATEIYGEPQKNFDQFRRQVTILAGYYEPVFNLDGSLRVVPKSLSFSSMDDLEFARWYFAVADVLLSKVLRTYKRADLDKHVNTILGFV